MSARGKDGVVREITQYEKKEQMMDDGRVRSGKDPTVVEVEDLVHKGAGQTRGQEQRNGTQVSVRSTVPSDGEGLRAMFSRSSTESVYRRFHIPYQDVPEWMMNLMLDADHYDKESLLAIAEGEIVAHAMYVRLGDGSEAEMAIIVEDGWQSKGVGKSLLSELAERAKLRGIETFVGEVLGENRPMLGLAAKSFAGTGYTMRDGVWHVLMPLVEPTLSNARELPHAA